MATMMERIAAGADKMRNRDKSLKTAKSFQKKKTKKDLRRAPATVAGGFNQSKESLIQKAVDEARQKDGIDSLGVLKAAKAAENNKTLFGSDYSTLLRDSIKNKYGAQRNIFEMLKGVKPGEGNQMTPEGRMMYKALGSGTSQFGDAMDFASNFGILGALKNLVPGKSFEDMTIEERLAQMQRMEEQKRIQDAKDSREQPNNINQNEIIPNLNPSEVNVAAQQPIDSTNMITFFNPELGKYVTGTYQDYLPFAQAKDGGIIKLANGGPPEEMSVPDLNSFRPGEVMSNPGGMPYMDQETGEMLSSQDLREDLDDVNRIMPDSGIAKLLGRFQKEADIASNTNETRQFLTNGIGLFYNKNTRQSEVHDMSNPESKEMLMKGILEFEKEITSEQEMFPPSLEADYRNMEDFTIPKAPNRMSSEPGITSIPGANRVIEGTTMEDVNIPSDMRPGMETNDPMLRYPEDSNRQEMLFASEPQQAGEGLGSIIIDAIRRSVENGSMTPREGEIAIQNMLESMGPKQIDLFTGARGGIIGLGHGGMSNPMDMQAMDDMMFKDPEDGEEWEYNV